LIIDCHCHAGKGDGLTGPYDTDASLEAYLVRAAAAGIEKTVLFPTFNRDYRRANRALAAIVSQQPGRFIGFAAVHPERDRGRVDMMIREAVEQFGFRGIKVHRNDARITREICRAAVNYSLPVLYDVMDEVSVVELIAREYPAVNFIIPHLGSFGDNWWAHMCLIDVLSRYPNVYSDTAGVRRFDFLLQAARRAGAHKILFGSDGPFLNPLLEIQKIYALGLSPQENQLILGGNLLKLFPGDRRPGRSPGPAWYFSPATT
jgi:uncharacterized protein